MIKREAYDSLVSNGLLVSSLASQIVEDNPLADFTDYFNTIISATDTLESTQETITSNQTTIGSNLAVVDGDCR